MRGRYGGGGHHYAGSWSTVAPMPPIAEHEVVNRPTLLPRGPLRQPQRTHRRSMSNNNTNNNNNRPAPPPYVPPAAHHHPSHLHHPAPPQYRETNSFESYRYCDGKLEGYRQWHKDHEGDDDGAEEFAGGRGEPLRSVGWKDRQWFGSRAGRWVKFGLIVFLIAGSLVGLVVGLTLGLKARHVSSGSGSKDTNPSSTNYPAGSYSFETTLRRNATSCTSQASTWRCYPYQQGSNATFAWILANSQHSSYNISSSDNPFAPSFTNLTTTLIDSNQPSERLTFSFDMDRTIIPSDSISSTNRAAKCTFSGTKFQGTIWTRRSGGRDLTDAHVEKLQSQQGSDHFTTWPGDVEVSQTRSHELGPPVCEDSDGNAVADVQAGSGDCVCEYSSF